MISYEAKIKSANLDNFDDSRKTWYSRVNLVGMFEALKYMKTRELMFLKGIKVRWLRATNVNFLFKIISTFDIDKKKCTAYASLDHYPHIPMFTSNMKERKKETDAWILDGGNKINGVDFGVDLDFKNGSWRDAQQVLFELLQIYNESGVLYAVWKTTHGFHIIIPNEQTSPDLNFMTPDQKRKFYYLIAEKLNNKFKVLDLSAYMETRVFRCPYMLDSDDEVVLPLKYEELPLLFDDKIKTSPKWVLKNIRLKNRGTFLNGELKKGNFEKFVELVNEL